MLFARAIVCDDRMFALHGGTIISPEDAVAAGVLGSSDHQDFFSSPRWRDRATTINFRGFAIRMTLPPAPRPPGSAPFVHLSTVLCRGLPHREARGRVPFFGGPFRMREMTLHR